MTQSTDSLIERIDRAINFNKGLLIEYSNMPASKSKVNDMLQLLTDCRARLSPPVIEGELEFDYKEALSQINSYQSGKHDYSIGFIHDTLVALHDELARVKDENKFLLEAIDAAIADTKYFENKYKELAKDVRRTNI